MWFHCFQNKLKQRLDAGFKTLQIKLTEIHLEGCEVMIPESCPALETLVLDLQPFLLPLVLEEVWESGRLCFLRVKSHTCRRPKQGVVLK